jgi:hypothetical protein
MTPTPASAESGGTSLGRSRTDASRALLQFAARDANEERDPAQSRRRRRFRAAVVGCSSSQLGLRAHHGSELAPWRGKQKPMEEEDSGNSRQREPGVWSHTRSNASRARFIGWRSSRKSRSPMRWRKRRGGKRQAVMLVRLCVGDVLRRVHAHQGTATTHIPSVGSSAFGSGFRRCSVHRSRAGGFFGTPVTSDNHRNEPS